MRPRTACGSLLLLCACAGAHGHHARGDRGVQAVDAGALYARGLHAVEAGDLTRAEQYLTLAEQAGYPAAKVLPWLLEICIGASRYRAALAHAEDHLARTPDDPRLQALVASLRGALGWPTAPDAPAQRGPTQPASTQEEAHDPSGDTPPQPDAPAASGNAPVG